MFARSSFNQPIDNWDVSKVENMRQMFCENKVFNQSLASWNTNSLIYKDNMFTGATAYNQPRRDF